MKHAVVPVWSFHRGPASVAHKGQLSRIWAVVSRRHLAAGRHAKPESCSLATSTPQLLHRAAVYKNVGRVARAQRGRAAPG